MSDANRRAMRSAQIAILVNAGLAIIKLVAGLVGHTYALIADAVESTADIFASTVVWGGLRVASRDPDESYPFGYGKAEPLAGAVVALMLLGPAVGIAIEAVSEIRTPHLTPAPWTLIVLVMVVAGEVDAVAASPHGGNGHRKHGSQGRCVAPLERRVDLGRRLRRHQHRSVGRARMGGPDCCRATLLPCTDGT